MAALFLISVSVCGSNLSRAFAAMVPVNSSDPTRGVQIPAENTREAFKQESRRIDAQGGVDSPSNYNKVESPGKRFRVEDGEL